MFNWHLTKLFSIFHSLSRFRISDVKVFLNYVNFLCEKKMKLKTLEKIEKLFIN